MIGKLFLASAVGIFFTGTLPLQAEDWPEWRGKDRGGIWTEEDVPERFPSEGLRSTWRVPIHSGFSGPAVADGRVFVTDFRRLDANRGIERVVALDEATGEVLWTHEWEADYTGLSGTYAVGPRATPTVDVDRVYVLGAKGRLVCLDVGTGEVYWEKDFERDYGTEVPTWGMTAAPLVEGDLLICLVGGHPDAKVVAFDKRTGSELWRALSSDSEPGYSAPIAVTVGERRQIIVWHPHAVSSLDPIGGEVLWEVPFRVEMGLAVATPVVKDNLLLISSFYNGSMLLELDTDEPGVRVVWRGRSRSEIDTDGLHSLISTPVLLGDTIYGICSYGQFRALDLATGTRLWETLEVTLENARWATGFLVRNGDRFFINNDRGELILARLSREGFQEIDRTHLIRPTSRPGNRRELGTVHWSHPAYANRHIVVRNDEEIVRFSLRSRP